MPKLEDKRQERFCQELIIDFNGARAAYTAGYRKKDRTAARITASRLLTRPHIQRRVTELLKMRSNRTKITQDKVLKELACLGFSNIKNYVETPPEGFIVFKGIDRISGRNARAIELIRADAKEGKVEFKLYNKLKALEMLGRHLGMFQDLGDKLADVIYEVSEKFMPRTDNKNEDE